MSSPSFGGIDWRETVVSYESISAALYLISSGIHKTPCEFSNAISELTECNVYFKKENLHVTGSFKERGARYSLLRLNKVQRKKGVIAASAGNHALALSYHGLLLDIPVTVVMPVVAPLMKVNNCKKYKATVIQHGMNIFEAQEYANKIAEEQQLIYINGFDYPNVIAGQGTMGLEILDQVKDVDALIIPVGGGGLVAGVAVAVKAMNPDITIIGAQASNCPSFIAALDAGQPVVATCRSTLADGLAVPRVGDNAFELAKDLVDKFVQIEEHYIALAVLRLLEIEKNVVEGAGAIGLAALLAGCLPELKGKNVVIPLCGGNIDTTVLGRCIERGLAADGRLSKFIVTVSDRPGGIADLTKIIADHGGSIKDILHERAWIQSNIHSVQITIILETNDLEHARTIDKELQKKYQHVWSSIRNDH